MAVDLATFSPKRILVCQLSSVKVIMIYGF